MGNFAFRSSYQIGAVEAEHDPYLSDCFVDTGSVDCLLDLDDSRTIVLGRTGSGKSALLKRLESVAERVIRIEPESLALAYVSSSDVMRRVLDAGGHLDLLFKVMWRHLIAVEIIRSQHERKEEATAAAWLHQLFDSDKRQKHQRALRYLETYGHAFWKDTDLRVQELVKSYEDELRIGVETHGISLAGASAMTASEKQTLQRQVTQLISKNHAAELNAILEVLDDVLSDPQKPVFVCVDGLDENWVDDRFRYCLIRALVETSRDFKRRVRHCKLVLALREDLMSSVLSDPSGPTIQREKYDGLCLSLSWTKKQLVRVADARVTHLIRRKYEPSADVALVELLEDVNVTQKESPLQFILSRTLLRPRDIILFLNESIARSHESPTLTNQVLLDVEPHYSAKRFTALVDEWAVMFPGIEELARAYPHQRETVQVPDISETWADRVFELLSRSKQHSGRILGEAKGLYGDGSLSDGLDWASVRRRWVGLLYRIGFVGIVPEKGPPRYSFGSSSIDPERFIDQYVAVRVHKAFYAGMLAA